MTHRVAILHFTPPGTVGGVEHVIEQHRTLLEARGYSVRIVAGRPSPCRVPVTVIPEIDASRPESVALEHELAAGVVSPRFHQAKSAIASSLHDVLAGCDVVIAHNALTLHFCLPLTTLLWEAAGMGKVQRLLAWCHDLSWANPLYLPSMHEGYPWEMLRLPAPNVRYVTVSHERKTELFGLWGEQDSEVHVVPNGVDVESFLRLSPRVRQIVKQYSLLECDAILLLPVRITRRKNIEHAIRAVRALKCRGLSPTFLISGPVAPHHPGRSRTYLDELKALRAELQLEAEVVFLADSLGESLTMQEVGELYSLADVLVFPSESEGFGLPILEAGLAGVPAVVSAIPIFAEVGGDDVWHFELQEDSERAADLIMEALETPQGRLKRRVRRDYRWDAILDRYLLPLLDSVPAREARDPVTHD